MKRIAIVTATRAEYGLLSPVIKEMRKHETNEFKVELIVTGTHLSDSYGMTINEIDDRIDYTIPISIKSENELDISTNQADALIKFTNLFSNNHFSAVVLLGDRYETLAIAIAAGNTRTPIFHLCGGDSTEGAIDEWIRHSITKISYLHFVTNEESKKRVIQLGESPDRVFNFGSTSIDNILSIANMSKREALASIGLSDCKYALCTYHPVTQEDLDVDTQIEELIRAIKAYPELQFIVTKSNSDQGGARINELLESAGTNIDNMNVFTSLGVRRYLSLMKYSEFVLGNSSSGIVEAPAFKVPTVNIGNRQKGRLQADSIVNCGSEAIQIIDAISVAMSSTHQAICRNVISAYGEGKAAYKIANKAIEFVYKGNINLTKEFYDLVL